MDYRKLFPMTGKILGLGFSLTKCDPSRAVCFQRKPSAKMHFIEHANSCPYLPNYDEKKVDGCSVGCGHLNQGLQALNQELEVPPEFRDNEDLVSQGKTHLDKHEICKKDEDVTHSPDLKHITNIGLKWTYIYF